MTVPVYLWAATAFMISARISDRVRMRGIFIIAANAIMLIGAFILIFAERQGVRYFGTFVVATGVYPSTAFNLIWNNGNSAGYYKRATSSGMLQMIGNVAGAIAGQVYVASSAPRYIEGISVSAGGNGVAIAGCAALWFGLTILNRRRDRKLAEAEATGDALPDLQELGDENPHFRFTY
jgi:hypothetical protein